MADEQNDMINVDDPGTEGKKKKKGGFFARLFGKKKADSAEEETVDELAADDEESDDSDKTDDTDEVDDIDDTDETDETDDPNDRKHKSRKNRSSKQKSVGMRKCPPDPAEKKNKYLKLYNELVRHAYDMSTEQFDRSGLSDAEIDQIYHYVSGDYPQLFWVGGYYYTPQAMSLKFRCTGDQQDDTPDKKKVNAILKELTRARKPFLSGLSAGKKSEAQYKAILRLYRRVVLTLDYDTVGLNNGIGKNPKEDDVLRSLRGALIEHKCVCAGYAVAMQYLMQCLRIKAGYVSSEYSAKEGSSHAFNMVNIGKTLCYIDATWGDSSDTAGTSSLQDLIRYDYFCVPYREFHQCSESLVPLHTPRKEFYPMLKEYNASEFEYYRRIDAYVTGYNENRLSSIFAQQAKAYAATRHPEKELGRFAVSFRCVSPDEADSIRGKLNAGGLARVIDRAKTLCKGNKKAVALLDAIDRNMKGSSGAVLYYLVPAAKDNKKK